MPHAARDLSFTWSGMGGFCGWGCGLGLAAGVAWCRYTLRAAGGLALRHGWLPGPPGRAPRHPWRSSTSVPGRRRSGRGG